MFSKILGIQQDTNLSTVRSRAQTYGCAGYITG